jgi:hypothetical protein
MKNRYYVGEDMAIIRLHHRDGTYQECLIDPVDVPLVKPYHWCAMWDEGSQTFYAVSKEAGLMHRLITGAPKGKEVDHDDHDGLNNSRENLKVCTRKENANNRQGANRNSRSGHKGVYWHKGTSRYRAMAVVDGKRKDIGIACTNADDAAGALKRYFEVPA